MNHYITKIHINHVRHLENLDIGLNSNNRKHLILTGKNGSGKTCLLYAIKTKLYAISENIRKDILQGNAARIASFEERIRRNDASEDEKAQAPETLSYLREQSKTISGGVELCFHAEDDLERQYVEGKFITAFFSANRLMKILIPSGVEDVKLKSTYNVNEQPITDLVKYLVHLKTQQAYANNEGDMITVVRIEDWFEQFEKAIRELMDDDSISLKYNHKNYNFLINQKGLRTIIIC